MLGSVLLVTALALTPTQGSDLQLTNSRYTYGLEGGTRPDGKFIPGDIVFISFDMENMTINDEGNALFEIGMEVLNSEGKSIYTNKPEKKRVFAPLGGSKIPAQAFVVIDPDEKPGTYKLNLTVTDLAKNKPQTLTKTFEVGPKQFGIVAVYPTVDERGEFHAPTVGVVGHSVFIKFSVVGFDRAAVKPDPKSPTVKPLAPQPDLSFEMTTLDANGKPTFVKPISYKFASELKEDDTAFSVRFHLPLTRVGKYTVRLKATDNITKKESVFDLPITVIEGK